MVEYFQATPAGEFREHVEQIIEMLRAQVEAGNVQSVVVLFAGEKDGDITTSGGRHSIRARHMDFLEDAFNDAMRKITDATGITAQAMREARAEALERMRRDSGK